MNKLREDVIWALVFDGGKARLFRHQNAAVREPILVPLEARDLENPPAHEQGRDKPGRAHAPTGGRSALEAGDPHDEAEARFVQELSEHIEAQAKAGAFDRLVLIAPAERLSAFHKAAPEAARRILGEAAADLTNAPLKDLEGRIERLVKPAGAS